MRRLGATLAVAALLFAAYLAWLGWLAARDALPTPVLALWGEAIALAEGQIGLGHAATTYPPLPLLLAGAWQRLMGAPGLPSPALTAAALAAGLGAAWWRGFQRAGLGAAAALIATLLVALHPFMLFLVAEGPGMVVVAAGLTILVAGLAGLHRRDGASDAMLAGGSLALLAWAHPAGLLLAFAALPCLALAAPRALLRRGPIGLMLVLCFPLIGVLIGMAFIAIVFGGNPDAALAVLFDRTTGTTRDGGASLLLAAAAPTLALPVLAALPVAARRMPPLHALALGCLALPVAAVALGAAISAGLSGLAVVAPAIALGAIAASWLAGDARRPSNVLPMLGAGLLGGVAIFAATGDPAAARLRAALLGPGLPDPLAEPRAVVAALGQGGAVLIDSQSAPLLVAARGTAAGLRMPVDPDVQLSMARGWLTEPLVALSPRGGAEDAQQQLRAAFRRLRTDPAPGYRMTHAIGSWRIFERTVP